MTPQKKAFLDMIAVSELGARLIELSDNGYNVIVGSTPNKPILFTSYAKHPGKKVTMTIKGKRVTSTAAGRYQVLARYAEHYIRYLKLPDFGHDSQDRIALQMIKECKALEAIESGDFATAVNLCRSRWASLPGAGYGQHENDLANLAAVFKAAGGVTA